MDTTPLKSWTQCYPTSTMDTTVGARYPAFLRTAIPTGTNGRGTSNKIVIRIVIKIIETQRHEIDTKISSSRWPAFSVDIIQMVISFRTTY